jgi:hypothetical protein
VELVKNWLVSDRVKLVNELDNRRGSLLASCCCEKLVAEAGNPEEGEHLPLEGVTGRLLKR